MESVLTGLRAAAEPTRLRLLHLLAQGDLTVTELTHILGQSQPRVSRHLKLMCDAGLLDRFPEGAWVFYRLAAKGRGASLARHLLDLLPADDQTLATDQQRLEAVRAGRAERAQSYFSENAQRWDSIRSLHVDQTEVEKTLLDIFAGRGLHDLVDMGTGTGRMLELLAPQAERAVGIDLSREMLSVARANLERAGLRHCMVRQGDITHLPLPAACADAVTIHQVLHYAAEPAQLVAEAARVLEPGGRLAMVDFAPHDQENLRDQHAHRRLGFADAEVEGWLRAAGLAPLPAAHLPGKPLTVVVWAADKPASRSPQT
ncbi:ArsR family transcriptional regulator [Paramagnetospirillum marisnigri]|uniref:ArsR family transcriptional regulator n=1 Tax=Paramagnetospirillum marisnigri TaxID=1285242 RepID=A0A178MTG6_9PROT|nr:metalloregulator ArsR/SmtB family transcription factor [Paramagnetospirillum marisnigri]OAN52970.1 ArsR family transcriptional regulator [Paramagnetospirillum marisnigri]